MHVRVVPMPIAALMVYSFYWFYYCDRLSHSCINIFHFVCGETSRQIVNLLDTQRPANARPAAEE